jgi:hypothetical protein
MENRGATFGADWLGKVKMTLQCAVLFAIFVVLGVPHWAEAGVLDLSAWSEGLVWVRNVLIYTMLAATALSGLQYLYRAATLLKADPVG